MPRLREEKRLREQRLTGIRTGIPTYVPPELTIKGFKLIFYNISQVKIGEIGADAKEGRISEVEFEFIDAGCAAFSFILGSLPSFSIGYRTRVDIHPYFDSTPWYSGFIQIVPKPGQKPPYTFTGFGFFEQLDWVTVTASYENQEVSLIIKDIVQNVVAPSTQIAYNAAKIEATTYTVTSISFDHAFAKDAIQQLAAIAQGYEFGVDNSREFYFRAIDTAAHYWHWAGRQFQDLEIEEDPLSIRNKLYVKNGQIQSGGTNIIGSVEDPDSIEAYGKREDVVTAPDILNTSDALQWAGQVLAEKKDPKIKAQIKNVLFDVTKAKIEPKGKIQITAHDGSVYTLPMKRVLYKISAAGTLGEIDCGQNPEPFEEILVGQEKALGEEQRLADKRTKELYTGMEPKNAVPVILDTNSTEVNVTNTIEDTEIYSFSIPAGKIGANDAIRVRISCLVHNHSGGDRGIILKIKLGTTVLYADSTDVFASGGPRPMSIDFILHNCGSQLSQKMVGNLFLADLSLADSGYGDFGSVSFDRAAVIYGQASEDLSQARILSITVAWSYALTTLEFKKHFAFIEKLSEELIWAGGGGDGGSLDELVKVGASGIPDYLNESYFERDVTNHIRVKQETLLSGVNADKLDGKHANEFGVTTFLGLTDTPDSYIGHGDKQVKVNAAQNALEFGRRIFVSGSPPGAGDGENGDIWLEY